MREAIKLTWELSFKGARLENRTESGGCKAMREATYDCEFKLSQFLLFNVEPLHLRPK